MSFLQQHPNIDVAGLGSPSLHSPRFMEALFRDESHVSHPNAVENDLNFSSPWNIADGRLSSKFFEPSENEYAVKDQLKSKLKSNNQHLNPAVAYSRVKEIAKKPLDGIVVHSQPAFASLSSKKDQSTPSTSQSKIFGNIQRVQLSTGGKITTDISHRTKDIFVRESPGNLTYKKFQTPIATCEHAPRSFMHKEYIVYLWMYQCRVVMSRLALLLAVFCLLFMLYRKTFTGTVLGLQHVHKELLLCFVSTLGNPFYGLLILCFTGGLWLKQSQFSVSGSSTKDGVCFRCQEAAERAQIAQRVKQHFVDHVFRNIQVPFNDILLELGHVNSSGSGEVLGSKVGDLAKLLQLMINCGETLTNVLDDVSGEEHTEAVQFEVNRDEFDLVDLIKLIAWGLKDQVDQKQICLQIKLDDETNRLLSSNNVICDKDRFVQTLGNFISIAVKFTPCGGELQLEVRREETGSNSVQTEPAFTMGSSYHCKKRLPIISEGFTQTIPENSGPRLDARGINIEVACLRISLKESGAGPSETKAFEVSEPYGFASPGWEEKSSIMGVDLSMAKLFVEKIGGRIVVDFKVGQGSKIYFSAPFPLVPTETRKIVSGPSTTITCKCPSDSWHAEKEHILCDGNALKSSFQTSCTLEGLQRDLRDGNDVDLSLSTACPAESSKLVQAAFSKKKILLVEDTEMNRIILRRVLENRNLHCDEAENGKVAVDLHKQGRSYDLVLMDKEMPVMDGYEATRQLRKMGVKTPIVALTGNALESDKELFFEAGVDDFQTKPLSKDKLLQMLARYGVDSS
ncbi:hypothetical protein O6H91_19G055300 [Diphasiastrum complanatum]|uniref:Uncharacterized protein n=4 Tax=Diphasiastrum complanatum TaxID=34168 RepID=A0ACC2AWM6_DIPCM|nr:hypothetical protein O6H91_19G055300 [Diphasiastrum complanatum]KAJ7521455.1 hypothetical protein O6H91_19G055300 [Diphasiastrum complanatum]KAJ7521456.1 hypothetical protein O6H91_19G055300 [Diphasiastrum complanatum]KAJ7521457.1 hypothetical protein O6H91_19G055300 [Diphasiastrum complanatum]